tara:strand:+ start:383 stop:1048 length:666 start_codon:yes stop_codon:yes gene_type:complete
MKFDQYGRPVSDYGYAAPASGPDNSATPNNVSAKVAMPTVGQMGGQNPQPWIRFPFFPTAPFYSTNPNVGYQVRYYSAGVLSTDGDVSLGGESIRTVQFDIPCRIIGIQGAFAYTANPNADNFLANGGDSLDTFLFRAEYTTGDRLHTNARLASTVIGEAANPAEIGGTGYTVDQGGSMVLGITPLNNITEASNVAWRIDITLHCLEMRGSSNFVGGRGGR